MNTLIQKAGLEDLDAILSLYSHLHSSDDPSPPKAKLEIIWKEFLSNPAMACLLATVAGNPVGTCSMLIVPNLTRGGRPYSLIENVVVHTAFQKKGIGKTLMDEAIKVAKESNCYSIMLLSGADNKNHAFYEKLGFDRNRKVGFEISFR